MKKLLRARTLLPVTSPPIDNGALVINGPLIETVGRFEDIRRSYPGLSVDDLGDVMLMPGLVNAHTHLELTELRDAIPEGLDFVSWLMELVRKKRKLSVGDLVASARRGAGQCVTGGVTAVGDIATSDEVVKAVLQGPLAGVVFREVIGDDEPPMLPSSISSAMKAGLSPHSTYTVPSASFSRIAKLADPLAIHAAESPEEVAFLKDGSGPIADKIYSMARWPLPKPSGLSPIAFLESTGILAAKPLLIHGVQVNEDDVRIIARHGLSVAHCPASNRRLGVGRFPFELYRRQGVNVALGTDSAIGTKRLDMFEEMREVKRLHGSAISCEETVRMATINGAIALGIDAGALEAGKRADITALSMDVATDDPYMTVVEEGRAEAVKIVLIGGETPGSSR
ncbi:MAG: amidohydrolase family protein [Nitrospirota bacterium]|nr:amidohydrolase family protein [Nitrospirota bacterium]